MRSWIAEEVDLMIRLREKGKPNPSDWQGTAKRRVIIEETNSSHGMLMMMTCRNCLRILAGMMSSGGKNSEFAIACNNAINHNSHDTQKQNIDRHERD